MNAFRRRVFTTLLALALAAPAFAQETRGTIEGVVKDASGGVLPGVTVEARSTSGATISTTTDAEGRYRFPALPVGTYTVVAQLQGFNNAQRTDVLLTIGQQLKVDLTLTVGTVTENVSVRAEAPIVDVKKNAVSTTITSEVIDLIPKGRNFLDAITGIPGTNDVARAGGLMIDGATASENRYVVDGMDTTDPQQGRSGKRVIVDFIDQIQVQRSGYNAEYRAATGGVVSAVSKSGTNRFRGDVGVNYSGPRLNRSLMGKVRPSLNISPIDDVTLEYVYAPRVHEEFALEPVFSLSGPILENRLWFFAGAAPRREIQERTVTWNATNPNGPQTQTFEDRERDDEYQYSITSQLSSRLRIRLNGSNTRTDPGLTVPTFDSTNIGFSNQNPLLFNPQPQVRTFERRDSYSTTIDWTARDNVFASVMGGYYVSDAYSDGGEAFQGTRRTFSNSNMTYAAVPAEFRRTSGFAENPVNTFNEKNAYQRIQLNGDVTTFRTWRGQHALKVGAQYERVGNQADQGQQYLNIAFTWDRAYQTVTGQAVRGTYGYYIASRSFTAGDVTAHNIGLFAQDQWSVNDKLTFNVGLRTDRTHMPSYRPENPSLTFDFSQKIAPRVGFAYDVRGDARWKAYGSWGIFYDIEKLEMPRGLWGADRWVQYVYTLDTTNWPSVDCADTEGTSGCPGTLIERLDRRHVSNEPDNFLVDPNLKPMKSQEATIGLDHELNNISSVGVRYTHKWLNTAIEDVGVIDPDIGAEIFYIANPGEGIGEFPLPGYPATPKPKRVYDGIDFSYNRRLHNNWSLNANVLLSRLWGNYTGLTNAQSESNRNAPNVSRAFDGLFMSFDATGTPVYGRMAVDMPIQLKALGTYMTPWGTSVGVDFRGSSGLLQTTLLSYQTVPVPVEGYGDLGRTPFFTQFDLLFSHTFRLPRSMQLSLQLNIENLFDQDTAVAFDTSPFLSGSLSFPTDGVGDYSPFFNGFDWRARMAQINAANPNIGNPDPRYGSGLGTTFQDPRTVRFYGRFSF